MANAGVLVEKSTGRSRITNGTTLLAGVDGRSTWARRLRDLIELHVNDLGGSDNVSEAERSIIRRAAALTVELENMERTFALAGEATIEQLDAYQRAANSMRRMFETIGIRRRPRDVTPTVLRDYLEARTERGTDEPSAEADGNA